MHSIVRTALARFSGPLRIADVRRMWLSDVLSLLGDYAAILALAVYVYGRSHSALAVGLVSAAAFAPAFGIGPFLATLADRFPYRSVMIASDVFRAAAYLVVIIPGLPIPAVIAVVFAAHCASFPFTAARGAQLPEIAGDLYGAAQALSQSTLSVGTLAGYAAGAGLLATVGAQGALVVDAATFVLSAVLISRVRARSRTERTDSDGRGPSAWERMRAGVATVRTDRLLFWPAALVTIAVVGATGADAMAVITVHHVSPGGHSGSLLAVLMIVPVVVALITTMVCPTDGDPRRLIRIAAWMAVISQGIALAALVMMHRGAAGTVSALIGYAALGVTQALTVPCVSVVGRRLPSDNRASVFSVLEATLLAGQAAGALLAGVLTPHLGSGTSLAVLLVPTIGVGLLAVTRMAAPLPDEAVAAGSVAPAAGIAV